MASEKLIKQLENQLWHPHIGWQVLRRSNRYQAAVRRFMDQVKAAEGMDGLSGYAMDIAGIDASGMKTARWEKYEQGGNRLLQVRMADANVEQILFVYEGGIVDENGHVHGPDCGHPSIKHGDHVDYVHDGHYHTAHLEHSDDHGSVFIK